MSPLQGQKGLVLLPILLVLTVLFLSTTMLLLIADYKLQNIAREQKSIQAFYAAESGLEITKANILQRQTWYNNLPAVSSVNNYTDLIPITYITEDICFEVEACKVKQSIGSLLALRSVGMCKASGDKILARKTLLAEIGVFGPGDYFKGVLVGTGASGKAALYGPMQIKATVAVDGDISLTAQRVIQGDIYAAGKITGSFSGRPWPNYRYIPPRPVLNAAYYRQLADVDGHVFEADTTLGGPAVPDENELNAPAYDYCGFYFVPGDIRISGYYRGQAVVFGTGKIDIVGNLVPGDGNHMEIGANSLTLVAMGDIDIHDHTVYAHLFTATQLKAVAGAVCHGAVCADGIDVGEFPGRSALIIQYENKMTVPDQVLAGLVIKPIAWSELYPVF